MRSQATAQFERDFMRSMVDHHVGGIAMAQMARERAVHREVRAMAGRMVASQREDTRKMQTWLRDWYGVEHQPRMRPQDRAMMDEVAALSGEEFEARFLSEMMKHHAEAIAMSRPVDQRAAHGDLRGLAGKMVAGQSREMKQMRDWLETWYGSVK